MKKQSTTSVQATPAIPNITTEITIAAPPQPVIVSPPAQQFTTTAIPPRPIMESVVIKQVPSGDNTPQKVKHVSELMAEVQKSNR